MIKSGQSKVWFARRLRRTLAMAGVVIAGLACISGGSWAAGISGPLPAADVPTTLADVVVLSDAAMARQTGTNLGPPAIVHDLVGRPTVLLWDELRATPQLPTGPGSTVTITTGSGQ